MNNSFRFFLSLNLALVFSQGLMAQTWPCLGTALVDVNFSTALPLGWVIVDGDTATPAPALPYVKGWQMVTDQTDTINKILVSPSWYLPQAKSNDWLISAQIALPSNPCLSWRMWSLDSLYSESMEIRLSTMGNDTADFLANAAVYSRALVPGGRSYFSANLNQWAGQNVYIAFRQNSNNKYALALDDILLTSVSSLDASPVALDPLNATENSPSTISGKVVNAGSDSIHSVTVFFTAGAFISDTFLIDSIDLGPNETYSFTHPQTWTPSTFGNIYFCLKTKWPNQIADDDIGNDSLCFLVYVEPEVGIEQENEIGLILWPNPFQDQFKITYQGNQNLTYQILGIDGKQWAEGEIQSGAEISAQNLPSGLFMIVLRDKDRMVYSGKIIRY